MEEYSGKVDLDKLNLLKSKVDELEKELKEKMLEREELERGHS